MGLDFARIARDSEGRQFLMYIEEDSSGVGALHQIVDLDDYVLDMTLYGPAELLRSVMEATDAARADDIRARGEAALAQMEARGSTRN